MNLLKSVLNRANLMPDLLKASSLAPLAANSQLFSGLNNLILSNPNQISSIQLNQIREYKVKTRLRKRCKSCYFVWRNGRLYVECNEHPRHKQHHIDSMLKGFDNIPNGYLKGRPTI
jgi:ribosomal protein L36